MRRSQPSDQMMVQSALSRRRIEPHEETGTVRAYVSHGRWVADCPCLGAELVIEGEPMTCGSCGAVRQVEWPDDPIEIETVLEARPRRENQNWRSESIVELEAENRRYL